MKSILVAAAAILLILIFIKFGQDDKGLVAPANVEVAKPGVKVQSQLSTVSPSVPTLPNPKTMPGGVPQAESFDALRNNPEIKKELEANFRQSIETSHGDFLSSLPPAQQEKVRTLLLNHRLGLGDLFTPGAAPPDPAQLMERDRAHEEDMKQALGEKGYQDYTEYKRSIPNRREVSQLAEKASALGIPLTPAQKQSVLEILNSERSAVFSKFSPESIQKSIAAPTPPSGSETSQIAPDPSAIIKAFEAEQAAADQSALTKAEAVLSEAQADLFLGVLREKLLRQKPFFDPPVLPAIR